MMSTDLASAREKYFIGQRIPVKKQIGEDKGEMVDVTIVGKYPHFALVSGGNYRWAVSWKDLA